MIIDSISCSCAAARVSATRRGLGHQTIGKTVLPMFWGPANGLVPHPFTIVIGLGASAPCMRLYSADRLKRSIFICSIHRKCAAHKTRPTARQKSPGYCRYALMDSDNLVRPPFKRRSLTIVFCVYSMHMAGCMLGNEPGP